MPDGSINKANEPTPSTPPGEFGVPTSVCTSAVEMVILRTRPDNESASLTYRY
jgi:hypothetical protein